MASQSVGERIRSSWSRLSKVPGGRKLFTMMVGRMAPYTGSIGAKTLVLEPGYAKVELKDRKAVRNHLNCVHAIALANLGELTTGLAMMASLPDDARGILAGIEMTYHKKARGTLTAECRCDPPSTSETMDYRVTGEIKNADGELVTTATALWRIGPRPPRRAAA